MEDRAAQLRARRAERTRAVRRRRRVAALVLLVIVVGAGALLAAVTSRHQRSTATAKASTAGRTAPARAPAGRASRTQAQLAAVRRLAAYGLPLYCGGRSRKLVALTFDDGPGPYTRLAVAKLVKHHLRATFFLVGKEIRAYPGLAATENAVAAVGDHTLTHPYLPGISHAEMVQQIAGNKVLIEHATGQQVVLFRPPYGAHTPAIDREVKELGMLEVLWTVDSRDSLGANYAGIEHNVLAGLHPGSIILMHENHGQTIRAMLTIFAALERDHLRAVTIPELMEQDPPTLAQLRAGGLGCGAPVSTGGGA